MQISDLSDEDQKRLERIVDQAYDQILTIANQVLAKCRQHGLDISVLKTGNPTLQQIVDEMLKISQLMASLDRIGYSASKADEYIQHVRDIADAVNANDSESLERCVTKLNQRSFL